MDGLTAGDLGFAALYDQQTLGAIQANVATTGCIAVPVDAVCYLAVINNDSTVFRVQVAAAISSSDAAGDSSFVQIEGISVAYIYHSAIGSIFQAVTLQGAGVFRTAVHQAQGAGAGRHIEAALGCRAGNGVAVQVDTDRNIFDLDIAVKLQIVSQVVVTTVGNIKAVKGQPGHILTAVSAGSAVDRQSLAAGQNFQHLAALGALNGNGGPIGSNVGDLHVELLGDGQQMSQILLGVGGVDHQQEVVFLEHVQVSIVDGIAILIGDDAVLGSVQLQSQHVAGQDILQELDTLGTFDQQTAHVGDVKQAAVTAGVEMFGNDAGGILDGHFPTAEIHHGSAGFHVGIEQLRTLQFAH